jgi:hypothetical protein
MYVCMYVCRQSVYVCICLYTASVYVSVLIIDMHMYMSTGIHMYMHACICRHAYVYVESVMCQFTLAENKSGLFPCIHDGRWGMYVCMYVYIYIYMSTMWCASLLWWRASLSCFHAFTMVDIPWGMHVYMYIYIYIYIQHVRVCDGLSITCIQDDPRDMSLNRPTWYES